jgi:hypothetical protein
MNYITNAHKNFSFSKPVTTLLKHPVLVTPMHLCAIFMYLWYNKPLASATLVAVPPGGKSAELDPNPNYYVS